ncbi:MAG: MgtC/SapB family protein [Vicinamibacteria bacterium]|nr:MgtC/SapB family protein [Vicinamibacteria bacterium]
MTPLDVAARFGSALGLGLMLGLERERDHAQSGEEQVAGVRTFSLIALIGATGAWLHVEAGLTWLLLATFAAVAGLAIVSYYVTATRGDVGATTEMTVLMTFLVGALCGIGSQGLAVALTVTVLLLVSSKGSTQRFVGRVEAADIEATLKFAIITAIVLPLLPNRNFGPPPLDVLNPYKVWLMVVLISGLNFASYVLVKVVGQEHGIGLTGVLGGLVSSTAVTLGFSQRSRSEPALAPSFTLGILVAWTVMFFRVLIVVALIDAPLARRLGPAVGLLGLVNLAACALLWMRRPERGESTVKSGSNPFELGEAIKFGGIFGVVTFVAKAAQVYLGNAGLYLAGAIAGLTDVDAIALSMASLAQQDPASVGPAALTILIALVANTLVKAGMALGLGAAELRRPMLLATVALLLAAAAGAFLIL